MSSEDEFAFEDDDKVQVPSAQELLTSSSTAPSLPSQQQLSTQHDQEMAAIITRRRREQEQDSEESDADNDNEPPTAFQLRRKLMLKRRKAIYQKLTPEQRDRFEMYLKGSFSRANVKRVMLSVLGTNKVADQIAVVMAGIAKIFAGDVVEQSLLVMAEWGDSGKIRPVHMREAYRRLKDKGMVPSAQPKRLLRL